MLIHGTTVATNQVLQQSGARVALITTAGFRDVLHIQRQARPRMYDLRAHRTEPLVPDTEGAGRQRGGCGMLRELRYLAERTVLTVGADRRRFTPWGIAGGKNASGSMLTLTSVDGNVRVLPTKTVSELRRGEVLSIQTPGGGGWGNPAERPRYQVESDVRIGLVSPERAREVYGNGRP